MEQQQGVPGAAAVCDPQPTWHLQLSDLEMTEAVPAVFAVPASHTGNVIVQGHQAEHLFVQNFQQTSCSTSLS